jgi:probable rRNA maturation factor
MVIAHKTLKQVSEVALRRFLQRARKAAGVGGKVNVVLASDRELRMLNLRYRGKDKPTDVLSFPAVSAVAHEFAGDIVVSVDMAVRSARRFAHEPAHEIKILILHGMLHLAGHDHETDRGQMARKEERLRRQLGLRDGLIARQSKGTPSRAPGRQR